MPLHMLRVPGLISSSIVRGFLVTGMYSTFFLGTLYLEHVLHYGALQTGLAYLPWTLSVAALSLGITARLVERFGAIPVLTAGMLTVVAGLGLLTTVGAHTSFFPTIFLAYLAIGLGIGKLVHAPADDRHGQCPGRRGRSCLRDRQRFPAGRRRTRARRARHDRHQSHARARGGPPFAAGISPRGRPSGLRHRRHRGGRWRGGRSDATASVPSGRAGRRRRARGPADREFAPALERQAA